MTVIRMPGTSPRPAPQLVVVQCVICETQCLAPEGTPVQHRCNGAFWPMERMP